MIFAAIVIASFNILNRQTAITIPAKHTQITFVGNADDPAISPNGRSIVYVSGAEGDQKVMAKDLAGGEPLEILSGMWCSSPSWSPDGSELAVNAMLQDSSRGTFFVPRLGGSFHRVPRIGEPLRWSPDGSRIATEDGNDGAKLIWFYNKATLSNTSIHLGGTFTWLRDLDWSPSGNRLLFLTVKKDEHYQIWTIKTDGSEQQQVVEDSVELFSPRWSMHEEAIYYLRDTGQTQDLMKVQISTATGKAQALPRILQSGLQTGASLTLSKNNKRALYTRGATSSNLWLTSSSIPN
jgi:Tol biopolymer transport system component